MRGATGVSPKWRSMPAHRAYSQIFKDDLIRLYIESPLMAGQYTAQEQTIGEMLAFTSVPLKVPTWQRSYSWRTQEVGAFWEDLIRFSERYPGDNVNGKEYFLGSVVMVDRTTYLEVLDGQQRLATGRY